MRVLMFVACCVYVIASLCYITCTILNHLNASDVTISVIVEISETLIVCCMVCTLFDVVG